MTSISSQNGLSVGRRSNTSERTPTAREDAREAGAKFFAKEIVDYRIGSTVYDEHNPKDAVYMKYYISINSFKGVKRRQHIHHVQWK